MIKLNNITLIKIIHPICCGSDIHKDKIFTCLITINSDGTEHNELRAFTTFTKDLKMFKNAVKAGLNRNPVNFMKSFMGQEFN